VGRRIVLEAGPAGQVRRFISGVSLAEGRESSWVTVTRTGGFSDPRYGKFDITRELLEQMVRNFDAGVYGQKVFIDVAHKPQDGAAGEVLKLAVEGDRLRALVKWTEFGREAVQKRGFAYLSAEYHENWKDNEKGEPHGCVLLGAGLVTRPCIKRLDPVVLGEGDGDAPMVLHPKLQAELIQEIADMKEKYLKKLREYLASLKTLSDGVIEQMVKALGAALDPVTDEAQAAKLCEGFEGQGKALAEQIGGQAAHVTLSVAGGLDAAAVKAEVARVLAEQAEAARTLAEGVEAKRKLFGDVLAEAGKALSEDTRRELTASLSGLIGADTPDAAVKALAESQAAIAVKMEAGRQLAAMGFTVTGRPFISVDSSNQVKALQESVDKRLRLTGRAPMGEPNRELAEKVLAEFDAKHAAQLHAEHKMLAGGDGVVSDVAVPAIFERTVIREALYGLVGLQFVNSGTYPFSSSALIPYSYRDSTAASRSSTRVYEGQGVPRAGVKQTSDTAYPIPQKLAFEVSDELRYLTGNGQLDFDTVAENVRNAVRIIGEDTEKLIFDEVLNASDEYATVAVTNEATATANGTNKVFVLDQFPVVRPRKVFDLQGNQVGSTLNPVVIKLNSVTIAEWAPGVSAGTYYTLDFNLGELRFVNEAGTVIAPTNTHAIVCSYSYTTNVFKFDTDLGSLTVKQKWDDFLYRFGLRKALIEDTRFYRADLGLMSSTVMTAVEQAETFGANFARPGTDLTADGNLGRIKGVPSFKAFAPGLAMADQRVLIGERGLTRYRMMKPWSMGALQDQKDANGRFTGKKEAYGDQFVVLHTPAPLKAGMTSVVLYSGTGRVDRAA
jgi:hypothetical protein